MSGLSTSTWSSLGRRSHCLSQLWGIAIQGMAEVWNSELLPFLCYRQLTNIKTSVLVDPAICFSQGLSLVLTCWRVARGGGDRLQSSAQRRGARHSVRA